MLRLAVELLSMSSSVSEIQDRESFERLSERRAINCPVCGGPCTDLPLYRYTVEQAAAHFCPPTRDTHRNRRLQHCIAGLWQGNDCEIFACARCGFGFGHPFVGGDEEFYSILHEQRAYPAWRWDYDVAITEAVRKFEGGKILDVGAGSGVFLRRLETNWQVFAVEGSELTRVELEHDGIQVLRGLGVALKSHANQFRVITLFQVLEHIADFEEMLRQCHALLEPGGHLVVTVPDGDAMIRQERVTGCHDMPPNHINKWTPESLSLVMRRVGFECATPIYEPPSWRNVKANLHMRMIAEAAKGDTVAAQIYRIRNRRFRFAALSFLGVPTMLRMFRYGRQLRLGGAFAIVGVVPAQHRDKARNK